MSGSGLYRVMKTIGRGRGGWSSCRVVIGSNANNKNHITTQRSGFKDEREYA